MDKHKEIKIIGLNTYCLIEIVKYLDYEDLLNLKVVHIAFNEAIDFIISKSDFKFFTYWNPDDTENFDKKMRKVARFLAQFGHKLKRLNIAVDGKTTEHHKSICGHYQTLIENFCSDGNVKYFSFQNFDMSEEFLKDNLTFFNSLEHLKVEFNICREYEIKTTDFMILLNFIATTKIKNLEIEIDDVPINTNLFPSIAASQLESLALNFCYSVDLDYVNDNISINTTL